MALKQKLKNVLKNHVKNLNGRNGLNGVNVKQTVMKAIHRFKIVQESV